MTCTEFLAQLGDFLDNQVTTGLVADIVAEWAGTHGEPFTLSLDGPAGGQYRSGTGGEHVDLDAIEFCRILSGRGEGTGILRHPLPL